MQFNVTVMLLLLKPGENSSYKHWLDSNSSAYNTWVEHYYAYLYETSVLYGTTCAQFYVEIQQHSTEEKNNLTGKSNETWVLLVCTSCSPDSRLVICQVWRVRAKFKSRTFIPGDVNQRKCKTADLPSSIHPKWGASVWKLDFQYKSAQKSLLSSLHCFTVCEDDRMLQALPCSGRVSRMLGFIGSMPINPSTFTGIYWH